MNQRLRDMVHKNLAETDCDVVDTVFEVCNELNRVEETAGERIETKAIFFFGIVGGTTVYATDKLAFTSCWQCILFAAILLSFVASIVCLFFAIKPRKYLCFNMDDIFLDKILQNGHNGNSCPTPQSHQREYKKFLLEQYADNIDFNHSVRESKAKWLMWGCILFMVELGLVTIFFLIEKIVRS
ncbi:MAG TPA: hypothetical protein PKJ37_02360 [Acidobacteriota bacterium]|nr:hypothetical protein [Acidobacteriota bacterium]